MRGGQDDAAETSRAWNAARISAIRRMIPRARTTPGLSGHWPPRHSPQPDLQRRPRQVQQLLVLLLLLLLVQELLLVLEMEQGGVLGVCKAGCRAGVARQADRETEAAVAEKRTAQLPG